ncbi:MAG: alanyl-tRNA editing protein [Stomatobaculum sp.]|nr:alanyl-tRNA editing protein [Stomatobaculum sp.]
MKTEELYYQDARRTEFDASVLSCVSEEKKGTYLAVLDRTAFFPEQGGQKSDLGVLGGAKVLDVRIRNDVITHVLDRPLEEGSRVIGTVDWDRRFDFMQQHTGEHMFSGRVHARFGYDNVGFRLSEGLTQLDFSGPIPPEALKEIEEEVNEAIWKDIPVTAGYPEAEVLKHLEYRSKLDLTEGVRIVEIPGIDRCACCAPHVESTGQVGILKIVSAMNYKGGVRIYIVCGKRALKDYGKLKESVQGISVLLSAKQEEVFDAVSALKHKEQENASRLVRLEEELLHMQALSLPSPEETGNVLLFSECPDQNVLRREVNFLAERYEGIAGIFTGTDSEGYRFVIGSRNTDLKAILPGLRARGFKCGGGKEQIQGSVSMTEEQIRSLFTEELVL